MSDTPATLRFDITEVRHLPGDSPTLELELFRRRYPPDPHRSFRPMRVPECLRATIHGAPLRALKRAAGRLTMNLGHGTYLLPLGSGPPCQLEVLPGTRAFVRFDVADEDGPQLQSADLHFSPPVMLHNVAQTLGQVHELTADRLLARLRPLRPRLPGWINEIGGLALGSADVAATVKLEHIEARSAPGRRGPVLRFAFSGHVRWFDQVEVPFDRVTLPATVLPVPWAALERLVSEHPLATAELADPLEDPLGLVAAFAAMLGELEGQLDLEVQPPPLQVATQTIDGDRLALGLQVPSTLGGRVALEGRMEDGRLLRLRAEELTLRATDGPGELRARLDARVALDLEGDLDATPWPERVAVEADLDLAPSTLPGIDLELSSRQSLGKGISALPLRLEAVSLEGGVSLRADHSGLDLEPTRPANLSGRFDSRERFELRRAGTGFGGSFSDGALQVTLRAEPGGRWEIRGGLGTRVAGVLTSRFTPIPELNLHQGLVQGELDATVELGLNGELRLDAESGEFEADLAGSRGAAGLERFEVDVDGRRLTLPPGTRVAGRLICGTLSAAGPGAFALDAQWDLRGRPCLLHHGDLAVSLLSPELRRGNLVLHLDGQGKLSFSGQKDGFYGVRYFNALLNPAADPGYLQELLRSDDAVAHVVAALETFNPELAERLTDLQALWRAGQAILAREGIHEPGDFIPRAAMTRIFSRMLTGDDRLRDRLVPLVKGATEGQGLDLPTAKQLLQQELGDFDIDYEVSFALNWLDLVLSPAEVLDPPRVEEELPLDLDPLHAPGRAGLPSAAEIYRVVGQGAVDEAWAERLAELAPRLTRRQLGYVLERATFGRWPGRAMSRLRYVYDLKGRIEEIAEGYGGVEFALQPLFIAGFLGEAVGPLPGINVEAAEGDAADDAWPPEHALGPEEIAHLLRAGLAWGRQDTQTQINNRLLLELMRRQPADLTRQVLIELGHQSPRALSGVLYAFLAQDQDQMAEPLDLVELLQEKLELPVPRQVDFMAGGRRARDSYYEALSRLADAIIAESGPYLSTKLYLQAVRRPVAPELAVEPPLEKLEQRAREAVARADELAAGCSFDGKRGGPRARSRQAYRRAFQACAGLLEREPRAFQLPWLKDFWLRNEEALKVLSVVRGYQEDRDDDRRWLAVQSGRESVDDEQDLLETVVHVLFWNESHQRALLADPLVRLLIDPEPGQLDFSIISCMGVITEGKDGAELEHAYDRLARREGVRIIRAHTGTARTLEYNARRIIESIQSCETPFGLVGYSQGCANALLAETMLHTGTPDEAALLDRLVCRNLLFSAANGSAHGTCGMLKFRRAMVLGERYLKHYQAMMSREAVEAVLSALKGVLDSRLFIAVLGGADSLTYERARVLHRDGQFLDRVPTSYTRAVATAEIIPETLEYLFYMLREQTGGGDQDTQVLITDAVGHATRVRNDYTAVLERCDMGSLPQFSHHWSPLTREVELVTTERDRERAAYQSPKDRLVWPWVQVNARFGRIRPNADGGAGRRAKR